MNSKNYSEEISHIKQELLKQVNDFVKENSHLFPVKINNKEIDSFVVFGTETAQVLTVTGIETDDSEERPYDELYIEDLQYLIEEVLSLLKDTFDKVWSKT